MSDRKNVRGYVFGAAIASAALGGVPGLLQKAKAQQATNAQFTFETSANGFSGTSVASTSAKTSGTSVTVSSSSIATTFGSTGSAIGPLIAESGTGSAFGVHAATNTAYSFPSGNGSAHAFSANNFAMNDYFEFDVPTTGIQNIIVAFSATGSNTGPRDFNLVAIDATGGATFTVGSYSVANVAFSTGAAISSGTFSFNLSSVTALNNNSSVIFRFVDADAVNITGGAVASAGTSRVDDVTFSGTAVSATPEPSTLALAAVGVSGLLMRRRQRILSKNA